ncbi:HAD-IA family hydrolase [Arthrobacter sp. LjRoot78]|uniref:HAD family hydrolase n=1 Tax=Arthrobacter sp. LjRoot78 TaxID=3342338 RepID=UPI003ED00A01
MTSLPHPQSVAAGVRRAFDLVIFDCDGVLVDSESIAIRVDQRVLADLGWELDLDEMVERFVGKSEAHFVAETERRLGVRLDADPLGQTGLLPTFEGRIFSASEVDRGKPAPDLFLHAARTLGVEPAGCAVVEDSLYGVQAARAAGMHVFAFGGGVTPAARLAGPGTTVFRHMRELPDLIAVGRP